jgi:hypothetical protein
MTCPTRAVASLVAALAFGFWACNASQPKQVEDPDPLGLGADVEAIDDEPGDGAQAARESQGEDDGSSEVSSTDGSPAKPQFTDSMTVAEAQAAVPPDADRLNMEQEVLAEPLQDTELYAPCKLGGGHFKANVAVWDGRVVGLDLETQPTNPALAKCLGDRIRSVKWRDKVKSLNTVEFSF